MKSVSEVTPSDMAATFKSVKVCTNPLPLLPSRPQSSDFETMPKRSLLVTPKILSHKETTHCSNVIDNLIYKFIVGVNPFALFVQATTDAECGKVCNWRQTMFKAMGCIISQ